MEVRPGTRTRTHWEPFPHQQSTGAWDTEGHRRRLRGAYGGPTVPAGPSPPGRATHSRLLPRHGRPSPGQAVSTTPGQGVWGRGHRSLDGPRSWGPSGGGRQSGAAGSRCPFGPTQAKGLAPQPVGGPLAQHGRQAPLWAPPRRYRPRAHGEGRWPSTGSPYCRGCTAGRTADETRSPGRGSAGRGSHLRGGGGEQEEQEGQGTALMRERSRPGPHLLMR